MISKCIVPDMLRGVRMSHSDDLVTIYHGSTEPITACGFHARYYLPEVYEAAKSGPRPLPLHRTEAGYPNCSTCDGGGCFDCTDPA